MPIPRPHPKLMAIGDSLAQGCGSRILNSSRIESILPSPLETGAGCDPTCFVRFGPATCRRTENRRQPRQSRQIVIQGVRNAGQELILVGRRRGLASYSDLFGHSDKLDDGLSIHFAHDLSAMHFDRDFTASQLTCDLLVKQTRHD